MKKISYAIMAFTAIAAASCSNDDITVETGKEFTLTIQPNTVVQGVEEFYDGDINNFGDYELRVRSLIYNEEGELVDYQIGYFDTYQTTVKFMPRLPKGIYTVLTTTDFVGNRVAGENHKYSIQFWALKDSLRMQDVYLEDCGYMGGDSKILGTSTAKITVSENGGSATIKPEMAGSLILSYFQNIHTKFSGKELYKLSLSTMETSNSVTFDGNDFLNNFTTSNGYNWYLSALTPSDFTTQNVYGYSFLLSTDRCHIAFCAVTQSASGGYGTEYSYYCQDSNGNKQSTFRFEKGKEYYATWDLTDISNPLFVPMDEIIGNRARAKGMLKKVNDNVKKMKDVYSAKQVYHPF